VSAQPVADLREDDAIPARISSRARAGPAPDVLGQHLGSLIAETARRWPGRVDIHNTNPSLSRSHASRPLTVASSRPITA